ncbi:hypothetical protein [Kouleothrix sp.]|uniref:hypothetical protein n=1 Tax=Kouleothrix sp. TaxID=2779161 RepID=UPI00391A100F
MFAKLLDIADRLLHIRFAETIANLAVEGEGLRVAGQRGIAVFAKLLTSPIAFCITRFAEICANLAVEGEGLRVAGQRGITGGSS